MPGVSAHSIWGHTLDTVEERGGALPSGYDLADLVSTAQKPLVFRGAASSLPVVEAGRQSARSAAELLLKHYNGKPVTIYRAEPQAGGRFHYKDDLKGFNFEATREPFAGVVEELLTGSKQAMYVGSTDLDRFFPGLREDNDPGLSGLTSENAATVLASAWIGNRTTAAAHFDITNNCAVCAVGRRRFTLFPPDQIGNLYPGPLEPTPAGQTVTMVDFEKCQPDVFPRFEEALEYAQVADLEPGDVLVYPAMWWHQVDALDDFNVLLNWWWNASPRWIDAPTTTLLHALLSLRGRPAHERAAWREVFDHYVFADDTSATEHLSADSVGELGELDEAAARRLRSKIINRLQR